MELSMAANTNTTIGATANVGVANEPVAASGAPKRLKDEVLDDLAARFNVAQFVSFSPNLEQRFCRILGIDRGHRFADYREAIRTVFVRSGEKSVNVRTFLADNPQTTDFAYGLKSVDEAIAKVEEFTAKGLFTIVNETIDVNDGGVSCVVLGDAVEFAPGDTPRCVEKPGTCSLPRDWARRLLRTVYGFEPPLDYAHDLRIEFSVHPLRRGYRHEHAIVWEAHPDDPASVRADVQWPNRFSRHIGDKTFGLMIADLAGLPVPRSTAVSRRVAPFSFGRETGCAEVWLRTCPNVQQPGRFTTTRGWTDAFALLSDEDPDGSEIGAVLAQAGVDARWSGACVTGKDGRPLIEGVAGYGDGFMQGEDLPREVPPEIRSLVEDLWSRAHDVLRAVRFEWVYDGATVWVVQLHRGATASSEDWIVEGEADVWHDFDAAKGLEALRAFVANLVPGRDGLRVHGRVGLTSHMADVIRKTNIPARRLSR
jgi:hypothetical protein